MRQFPGRLHDRRHQSARPRRAHSQRGRADQHRGDDLTGRIAHRGANTYRSGDDFRIGDQKAALANAVQIGRDPGRIGAGGRRVALQPLRQHLGLHRLRRMGQQHPAAAGVQRHLLADLGIDPQTGVGLIDRDGLALHAFAHPKVDIFPGRVAERGEIWHRGRGQRALLGRARCPGRPIARRGAKVRDDRPG